MLMCIAGGEGIEPSLTASKAAVLPLDDPATGSGIVATVPRAERWGDKADKVATEVTT